MNKKIDDVLYSLLQTKEYITKKSIDEKDTSKYDDTIKGLDSIVVNYTMNNNMSNKEILDTTLSMYNYEAKKSFVEKVKDTFNVSKKIKNIKNKIDENHKKKETKKQYEQDIVDLVKEKLKTVISDEKKEKTLNDEKSQPKETKDNDIQKVKKGSSFTDNEMKETLEEEKSIKM